MEVYSLESRWVVFTAWGHRNVRASHYNTIEVTKDDYLTPRGDCIIGIKSSVAASDLPEWFKETARSRESLIVAVFCSGDVCDSVVGRGDERLSFSDDRRIVLRRSTYTGPDTVMVRASKPASGLDRRLVERLARGSLLLVMLTALRVRGFDPSLDSVYGVARAIV